MLSLEISKRDKEFYTKDTKIVSWKKVELIIPNIDIH